MRASSARLARRRGIAFRIVFHVSYSSHAATIIPNTGFWNGEKK